MCAMTSIFLTITIILYALWDVNYFLRTYFTVITSRLQRRYNLNEVTTIFGMGTFQDCDVSFRSVRVARLARELDFARYHFYDRTGVYKNSIRLNIKSLQGSTLVISSDELPLFTPYQIKTKLIYWDDRSLFFHHEVVTLHDGRVRVTLLSRQYAMGGAIKELLRGLPGSDIEVQCPKLIQWWLQSMLISSRKLREEVE